MSTHSGTVNGATPRAFVNEAGNAASQIFHRERLHSVEVNTSPKNNRKGSRAKFFRTPSQYSVWRRGWQVPFGIIGFYILGRVTLLHHQYFTALIFISPTIRCSASLPFHLPRRTRHRTLQRIPSLRQHRYPTILHYHIFARAGDRVSRSHNH
jgi:hypothetical protein